MFVKVNVKVNDHVHNAGPHTPQPFLRCVHAFYGGPPTSST